MKLKTAEQREFEIERVKEALRRPELARDAVSLLAMRLIELRNPNANVEFVSEEAVEVTEKDGKKIKIFFANLLSEAEKVPTERLEIVERYTRVRDTTLEDDFPPRENIVSTVRHADYRIFLKEEERDLVTEHLIGELWIVWAVDYPKSISIISALQINNLGLTKESLHALGLANVRTLLSDLEWEGRGSWFLLTSINSEYLSSSLLMDEVWDFAATLVEGDLVVSVPARDTVIFTGTRNPEGLRIVREQAAHVIKNGDHVLSDALFQRVGSGWALFT